MNLKTIGMLSILVWSISGISQAGIIVGGTRVIFNEDRKETSLNIDNPDMSPYLIQSWIEGEDEGEKIPFLMTPPLFRLNGKQQNILRILRVGTNLPSDREAIYWINVKSIPTAGKHDNNVLQVAVKTRIKLIYRPKKLKGDTPEGLAGNLKWQRQGHQLIVENPTAYYMNFQTISLDKHSVPNVTWVAPFSSASFALPAGVNGKEVSWRVINDYGAIGKAHHATI